MKVQNLGEMRRKEKEENELWVLGRAKGTPVPSPKLVQCMFPGDTGPQVLMDLLVAGPHDGYMCLT